MFSLQLEFVQVFIDFCGIMSGCFIIVLKVFFFKSGLLMCQQFKDQLHILCASLIHLFTLFDGSCQ